MRAFIIVSLVRHIKSPSFLKKRVRGKNAHTRFISGDVSCPHARPRQAERSRIEQWAVDSKNKEGSKDVLVSTAFYLLP
jgi:hypothetical protein